MVTGTNANQWVRQFVQHLPPGSFAYVMASGIVSTAFAVIGWDVVSIVLVVLAIIGGLLLLVAQVWRLVSYRSDVIRDAQDPGVAFGFLTVVAAFNVVGIRLYAPDAPAVTIVLGIISVPLWLLLVYGIPSIQMLHQRTVAALVGADGSWFLWVVATQSLATAAAVLAGQDNTEALAAVAVGLWGIGVMLYLMLATLVTLKLLTATNSTQALNPSYWIYMGATAITVLAGSRILVMSPDLPIMQVTTMVVAGLTFVLWAFGMWWVPLLVIFGVWRHLIGGVPLRYEHGLWSIVFPLGMFSVASMHFGRAANLSIVAGIGQVGTFVAGVVWLVAFAAMILSVRVSRQGG